MTSQPGMTSHHDQAIELNVIETVSEDNELAASRPPQICINLSPSLSRQNTADTIDSDCPEENQSPRRIFTEFSSGTEANSKENQSNNNNANSPQKRLRSEETDNAKPGSSGLG